MPFAAVHESVVGSIETCRLMVMMSACWSKPDIAQAMPAKASAFAKP